MTKYLYAVSASFSASIHVLFTGNAECHGDRDRKEDAGVGLATVADNLLGGNRDPLDKLSIVRHRKKDTTLLGHLFEQIGQGWKKWNILTR